MNGLLSTKVLASRNDEPSTDDCLNKTTWDDLLHGDFQSETPLQSLMFRILAWTAVVDKIDSDWPKNPPACRLFW